MMDVNPELCIGCGACVRACPENAIRLRDGIAQIAQALCVSCERCMDVCPTGAIYLKNEAIVPAERFDKIEVIETRPIVKAEPAKTIVKGTALALVFQQVVPRLVDVLANVLEQRLSAPAQERSSEIVDPLVNRPRRRRQRRGRKGSRF